MIEEVSKTIKAQLYERASSPLMGAFLLSWAIWNYKFFIIVFSGLGALEKIVAIKAQLFPSLQTTLLHGGLYPTCTALAFIFLYPIPAKYIYEHSRKTQLELKKIQQKIDDETPLTKEEARKIRKDSLKAVIEIEMELDKKTDEVKQLRAMISELERNKIDVEKNFENPTKTVGHEKNDETASRNILHRPAPKHDANKKPIFIAPSANKKILVTAKQFLQSTFESFISEIDTKDSNRYLIDIDEKNISIQVLHENGKIKTFYYEYELPPSGSLSGEISRIKKLIEHDLGSIFIAD